MPVEYSWSWEPPILVALAIYLGLYVLRWYRVRRDDGPRGASVWRLAAFTTGVGTLFVALISPVDALGDQVFSMHMVQHLLLIDVAPVFLVLGMTKMILRPITRRLNRIERAAGPLGHPIFAVVAYIAAMWAWHAPAAYDAALSDETIHTLEHVCFTAVGLLYWWHLLSPIRSRLRLEGMGPIGYMAATKLFVGALGVGLTFYPHALYPFYASHYPVWGMTARTDQEVGGVVMALEQSLVMGSAVFVLFVRMLAEADRKNEREERLDDRRVERGERLAELDGEGGPIGLRDERDGRFDGLRAAAQSPGSSPNTT